MILRRNPASRDTAGNQARSAENRLGTDPVSPAWVGKLDAAKNAQSMLIAAAFRPDGTDAWISFHERKSDGAWHMAMSTPGYIGEHGLYKTREGDRKTPTGVFLSPSRVL